MTRLRKCHVAGFLGILAIVGCRQDMHDQPRLKALAESDFYADLRSARNPVDGTVARGQLHEDAYFHTGKVGANPGNYMPSEVPVNEETLARGRERFNIYCAPCHSRVGDGNGMIVQRGYRHPPTYHQDRLRQAPLGRRRDPISAKDVPHRLIRYGMAEIGQRSDNSVVSPTGVLSGDADNERLHFGRDWGPPG